VFDKILIQVVKSDLELILADNVKAWQMHADGTYSRIINDAPQLNSQALFISRSVQKKTSSKFNVNEL